MKSLFCKHDYIFYGNIHGDLIDYLHGCRSAWICTKCKKLKFKKEYIENVDKDMPTFNELLRTWEDITGKKYWK